MFSDRDVGNPGDQALRAMRAIHGDVLAQVVVYDCVPASIGSRRFKATVCRTGGFTVVRIEQFPLAGRWPGTMGKRCYYEAQFAFILLRRDIRKAALPDGLPIFSVNLANRTG